MCPSGGLRLEAGGAALTFGMDQSVRRHSVTDKSIQSNNGDRY